MYYQSDNLYARGMLTPAVRFLLIATGVIFLVQIIFDQLTGGGFTVFFGLSWAGIRRFFIWQFITCLFLHGGIFHLLLNMLGLFFFGPDTERAIGTRKFFMLYFAGGMLGGLGWLLITAGQTTGFCIGASGAIFGILGAFAALFPKRPITLLVFFVFPVTMQARSLAIALAVFSLLATVAQPGNIAYAAHLAGGLVGYFYILLLNPQGGHFMRPTLRQLINDLRWRWYRRKFKVMSTEESRANEDSPTTAEVNAVLEKISKYGIKNLTRREHEILKSASKTWQNRR